MKARWIVLVAIIILLIAALGYYVHTNPGKEKTKTVETSVSVAVRVLDLINNTPVTGVPVYFIACSPNGTSMRDVHLEGLTEDDGWALFFANYTLGEGQTIYLAASNRKPLVDADFTRRAFNGTGYLGAWNAFNYSVLYNDQDEKAVVNGILTIDLDSGRMT